MTDTWPPPPFGAPARPEAALRRRAALPAPVEPGTALTALAPMQDVTDIDFMRIVARRGAPDYFVTEYFRVHGHSTPEEHILRSARENDTGRPVFAQLLGEHLPDLGRTIDAIQDLPWAGIDLNMGCPAPKVYKKNVGGGLLRDPIKVDELLGYLRDKVRGRFTVKMRIGFEDDSNFERILRSVARHDVELLALHARTVKEMYRSGVHYEYHRQAVASVPCPVVANGNVTSARKALEVLRATAADGVMVGRAAIRNPWIFGQIRDAERGRTPKVVTLAEVHTYIEELHEATKRPDLPEFAHVNKLKKYLNFIGLSVDPEGAFLHEARRATTSAGLFEICRRHLLDRGDAVFADEPYEGLVARPNREGSAPEQGCEL